MRCGWPIHARPTKEILFLLALAVSGVPATAGTVEELERLLASIEEHRAEHIGFLQQLVRAGKEGEEAVQERVRRRFLELGFEVDVLRLLPTRLGMEKEFAAEESIDLSERISVVGKLPGSGGGRSLLFFAHPDSEPVNPAGWTRDPFGAVVEEGRLYGWGVADDLAGVAIMAEAASALRRAGWRPAGDLYLGSTASKRNARGILAVLDKGYRADATVYLHPAESGGGMTEIKAVTSGMLRFRLRVGGEPPATNEPGHTAFAHRAVNAIDQARRLMAALARLDAERGGRVHHRAMEEAIGRSTNLLVSYLSCGVPDRWTRVPTSCVIGASLTFPPREEMAAVQKEVEESVASAARTPTPGSAGTGRPWSGSSALRASRSRPITLSIEP
jgi:acetylornithine deacetylase/succinyl-diaminopimelate desuccinylase-like protein